MTRVWAYAPGAWLAVVGPHCAVLVDPLGIAGAGIAIRALWDAVRSESASDDVLDVLTSSGVRSAPEFAIVEWLDGGLRTLVRGGVVVSVDGRQGETTLTGARVSTWSEQVLDDVDAFAAQRAGADAPGPSSTWPLSAGVVATDRLTCSTGSTAVHHVTATSDAVLSTQAPTPATETAPETALDVETQPTSEVKSESQAESTPGAEPERAASELTRSDLPDDGYDHMFGVTVVRRIEDAAVRVAEEPSDVAPRPSSHTPQSSSPESGLDDLDHDGQTMMASELARLRSAAASTGIVVQVPGTSSAHPEPAVATPVSLLGLVCSRGHANPLHRSTCRACSVDLRGAKPQPVPQPAPLRLRVSTGQVVDLDRPVLVGRSPAATRVSGDGLPHLVTVPSPDQDISRTHLQLVRTEWEALVTDLGSSNGTVLTRPGEEPVRLHSHEAVLVDTGCVLDLGSGVTLAIEVAGEDS